MKTMKTLTLLLLTLLTFNSCDTLFKDKCFKTDAKIITINTNSPRTNVGYSNSFLNSYVYIGKSQGIKIVNTINIIKHMCGGKNRIVYTQTKNYYIDNPELNLLLPITFKFNYNSTIELHNTEDFVTVESNIVVYVQGTLYNTFYDSINYQYRLNYDNVYLNPEFNITIR
jgi:hypothetical protein